MGKAKRKRIRKTPPLDSEDGRTAVNAASDYLTNLRGSAFTNPEHLQSLPEHLAWTAVLPGFVEAQKSACHAWMHTSSELPFWREIASAKNDVEREKIVARQQTNLGLSSAQEISSRLLKQLPPVEAYKTLSEASKNAASNKPPPAFPYDFATCAGEELLAYLTEKFPTDTPTLAEVIDSFALIQGRKSSPMRTIFVSIWMYGGLWLADAPDIEAFFTTKCRFLPEMRSLSKPTAETIRVWKSELGLISYPGKGRLRFDQVGNPRADKTLYDEANVWLLKLKENCRRIAAENLSKNPLS